MTYREAVEYLDTFVNYERCHAPEAMRAVKLERMTRLCQRLGEPQRRFRSVLITGTNGKGSVAAMLYSMLRESGLRVGAYTSPHLESLRERIRCWSTGPFHGDRAHGDDWISEEDVASTMARLQPILEAMRHEAPESPPTYFEVLTALAFLYFSQRPVDVAVVEVGLGGRLDATNVLEQAVSVVTPISLDHTDVLGPTAAAIAKEKAGIIKPRQMVISASQEPSVEAILQERCRAQGVPLVTCGRDLSVTVERHDLDGLVVSVTGLRGVYESLTVPIIGRHQAQNAALAIAALEALSDTGVPHFIVERGLEHVEWPGRLEIVSDSPLVILDGAHNPQAAGVLREALGELCAGRPVHLLIGASADKAVEELGRSLGPLAVSATCTASRHPRALAPDLLAAQLIPHCPDVHVMADPIDAYTYLINAVGPSDVILVTGSLFLIGELRAALRHAHVRPRRPRAPERIEA